MKHVTHTTLSLLFMALVAWPAAAADPKPGVQLSVYNNNFALVKDRRLLDQEMRKGFNLVRFRDVASTIDATSVHFRSLTDPSATVIDPLAWSTRTSSSMKATENQ